VDNPKPNVMLNTREMVLFVLRFVLERVGLKPWSATLRA